MSTAELRKRLIEKIRSTDDKGLLEEVYRLLEMQEGDSEIYVLNDEQKKAMEQSRKEISEGKYLSDEEANKEIDEWLNHPGS